MSARFRFIAAFFSVLCFANGAAAFCRTTTCDQRVNCQDDPKFCCIPDEKGCDINAPPISWPTSCVSYNVQEDGSERRGIDPETLSVFLDRAYDQWTGADCGEATVSLAVEYRGQAECGEPEFNQGSDENNANIWMFRDDGTDTGMTLDGSSGLDPAALAVTTVSFNEDTAEIYDVDVELLSFIADFTTGDEDVRIDLESVVTHEAGHFLGLDHSDQSDSTMYAGYFPRDKDARILSEDDVSGICAAYPEGRSFPGGKTCEPRGKYSTACEEGGGCGCSVIGSERPFPAPLLFAGVFGLVAWRRRRRGASS